MLARSPACLLLAILCVSLFDSAIAQSTWKPPHQPPAREGETRFMFGFKSPKQPAADAGDTNPLVLIRPISYGLDRRVFMVRSIGSGLGLPGCEVACVRKVGPLRHPRTGKLIVGERRNDIYRVNMNEAAQLLNIQDEFDRSGSKDYFFARLLGCKESRWPHRWKKWDEEDYLSVEIYEELIQGRTFGSLLENLDMQPMGKKDTLSLGVLFMKGIFPAVQFLGGLTPPLEHNDIHAHNIMIGWTSQTLDPSYVLGSTRPFLINFGHTRAVRDGDSDYRSLLLLVQDILSHAQIMPNTVTPEGLLKSYFKKPTAERAVRNAYLYLMSVKNTDPQAATFLNPKVGRTEMFKKLQKICKGVKEIYSDNFQRRLMVPPFDQRAEPLHFATREALMEAARDNKIAGPWFVTEVQRNGDAWVVRRVYDDKWCDWMFCMDAKDVWRPAIGD